MDKYLIPTWLPPENPTDLDGFILTAGPDLRVHYDKGDLHPSRSIKIIDVTDDLKYERWIYYHALVTNTDEPIDYYENIDIYELEDVTDTALQKSVDHSRYLDGVSFLDKVFEAATGQNLSYAQLYNRFESEGSLLLDCIKNYFAAGTLTPFRFRRLDMSYWQVVMYVSIIEVLLGTPPVCEGKPKCTECGKVLDGHYSVTTNAWLKSELFDKIKGEKIRKQYKGVLEQVRNHIRHKSVHEGLMPTATHPALGEGKYSYDTRESLKAYVTDKFALDSLVKQLRELTRFMLLNKMACTQIYPELRGTNVHSIVFGASISPTGKNS